MFQHTVDHITSTFLHQNPSIFQLHIAIAVLYPIMGKEARIKQLIAGQVDEKDSKILNNVLGHDVGRLEQGYGTTKGTNTF